MAVAPEGFEAVPSWAVSAEQLRAWGFPVREVVHSMGSEHVVREGVFSFSQARHAAWAAGFVEVRSMPAAERERRSAARLVAAAEQEVHRAESLAWALANRRVRVA
jgi:hypothetical protein